MCVEWLLLNIAVVPLSSLQQTPGATGNCTTAPGCMPRADLDPSSKALKPPVKRATATNLRKRRYVLSDEDEESEAETVPGNKADNEKGHKDRAETESEIEGGNTAKETDEDESEECYQPRSTRTREFKAVCIASSLAIVEVTTDHLLIQFPQPGYQPSPVNQRGTLQSVLKDDSLSAFTTPLPTGQSKTNPATATTLPVTKAQKKIRASRTDSSHPQGRNARQQISNVPSPSEARSSRQSSSDRLQAPASEQDDPVTSPASRRNEPQLASQPVASSEPAVRPHTPTQPAASDPAGPQGQASTRPIREPGRRRVEALVSKQIPTIKAPC